ncbi:MAG: hypothetical protein R3E86_19550 [Pseudomonadales bacterium]
MIIVSRPLRILAPAAALLLALTTVFPAAAGSTSLAAPGQRALLEFSIAIEGAYEHRSGHRDEFYKWSTQRLLEAKVELQAGKPRKTSGAFSPDSQNAAAAQAPDQDYQDMAKQMEACPKDDTSCQMQLAMKMMNSGYVQQQTQAAEAAGKLPDRYQDWKAAPGGRIEVRASYDDHWEEVFYTAGREYHDCHLVMPEVPSDIGRKYLEGAARMFVIEVDAQTGQQLALIPRSVDFPGQRSCQDGTGSSAMATTTQDEYVHFFPTTDAGTWLEGDAPGSDQNLISSGEQTLEAKVEHIAGTSLMAERVAPVRVTVRWKLTRSETPAGGGLFRHTGAAVAGQPRKTMARPLTCQAQACRPYPRRIIAALAWSMAIATATSHPIARAAPAAGATPAQRFAGVVEWQGEFTVEETGAFNHSGTTAQVDAGTVDISTRGTFTLGRTSDRRWDPERGIFEWTGDGAAQAKNHATRNRKEWGSGDESSIVIESAGTVPLRQVGLKISLADEYSTLHWGLAETPLTSVQTGHAIVSRYDSSTGSSVFDRISLDETRPGVAGAILPNLTRMDGRTAQDIDWYPQVASGPGVISISAALPVGGLRFISTLSGEHSQHNANVLLYPVYADFEVEVQIEGYDDWRPEGSIANPEQPGNHLVATATLKPRNEAGARNMPRVRRFSFSLGGVSREPGVCLNWPLAARDSNPDLRLALAGVPGALSEEDQVLNIEDPPANDAGQPYGAAQIDAYDYGARAILTVTAELDDGRELVGVLHGADRDWHAVDLPKQSQTVWIADAWTAAHGTAELPPSDDDETTAGQPLNGDGYTLYEEYRGFVVNGRHVEGDPKRKDYFVLNLIGADARPGIALFEELSDLRVHSKLRRSEMSQKDRLMNGNRRDAPHRVDQHGVWVKEFSIAGLGGFGAYTPLKKAHVAGRPGIVIGIGLLARNEPWSDFSRPTVDQDSGPESVNIPARDAAFAYDRAIAHELMHSVGVEHHGEGNFRQMFEFLHANDPMNALRTSRFVAWRPDSVMRAGNAPQYRNLEPGPTLTLIEEGTGRDLTAEHRASAERYLEYMRRTNMAYYLEDGARRAARNPDWGQSAQWWADRRLYEASAGGMMLHIGVEHGEDSGDADCIMRYYFAKAYPRKGSETDFIYIPQGSNVAGLELCESPRGTGVNAASHEPQSRHGDAAPGRGNCRSQISPNDAIPPRRL